MLFRSGVERFVAMPSQCNSTMYLAFAGLFYSWLSTAMPWRFFAGLGCAFAVRLMDWHFSALAVLGFTQLRLCNTIHVLALPLLY